MIINLHLKLTIEKHLYERKQRITNDGNKNCGMRPHAQAVNAHLGLPVITMTVYKAHLSLPVITMTVYKAHFSLPVITMTVYKAHLSLPVITMTVYKAHLSLQ